MFSTSMSALTDIVRQSLPDLLGVSEVNLVETANETEHKNHRIDGKKNSSHVELKSKNRLNQSDNDKSSRKSRVVPINIAGEDEDVESSTISVARNSSSYHLHLIKHDADEIPEPKGYEEENHRKGGLFNESMNSQQESQQGIVRGRSEDNESSLCIVLASIGQVIRTRNECDTALHALLSMSSFRSAT